MKLKSLSELAGYYDGFNEAKELPRVNLCNCTGPQGDEKKCPCQLRENESLPEDYKKNLETFGRSGG